MKALVFKSPWDLAIEERLVREPGPGEALVEVIATGVCGSDLHGFTGKTGRRHPGQVMGHETVGRVASINGPSGAIEIGQVVVVNPAISCGECPACHRGEEQCCADLRVIGVVPEVDAAFAEYLTAPIANLVPLPSSTPEYLGALVEPLAVGWHAVRRAGVEVGEEVVVLGGGPIGQAVALAATRAGASRVLVSENLQSRRELLERLGFEAVAADTLDVVVNEAKASMKTLFDAVGSTESVSQGLRISARGGRLILIGMAEPRIDVPAFEVSVREREIMGTFCYSRGDFAETVAWLADNVEVAEQLVDAVEPLESGPQVFADLASYTRSASKILLSPLK